MTEPRRFPFGGVPVYNPQSLTTRRIYSRCKLVCARSDSGLVVMAVHAGAASPPTLRRFQASTSICQFMIASLTVHRGFCAIISRPLRHWSLIFPGETAPSI